MNIIVLQHIKIEDPGYIKDLMLADGFNLTTIELDEGEKIPEDLSKFDGMFCMGGPMDTYMEKEYPWLIEEKKAIKEFVVNLKKPYLGFCLGCQLLGEVVGGKVVKSNPAEIGIMDINFSNKKDEDKLFSKFPNTIKSLTRCYVGGQTMPVAIMENVEKKFKVPLIELWGMTEIAGLGSTHPLYGKNKHGSIGCALPFCELKIVDVDNVKKNMPIGEVGELMVKGPITMMGYFGDEKRTKETLENDGWLHSGDLAKMDEDGYYYIVDRKKDMILTAGYNVYPAEIERVLAKHPSVSIAAVGKEEDKLKGEIAKAYVVLKENFKPSEDELINFCREHLAAYKCPRKVIFVDDVPKTSSGKIMRRELNKLDNFAIKN